MTQIKTELGDVANGVKQLLSDARSRPDALTGKTVILTVISTGACIAALWGGFSFLLAASPVVSNLAERMRDMDRADFGRVALIERRISELEAATLARPSWHNGVTVRRPAAAQ
jgi:hypothetical protein